MASHATCRCSTVGQRSTVAWTTKNELEFTGDGYLRSLSYNLKSNSAIMIIDMGDARKPLT